MSNEKTEAEITEEFLKKYKELVMLYHRDFYSPNLSEPPQVVIVKFEDNK